MVSKQNCFKTNKGGDQSSDFNQINAIFESFGPEKSKGKSEGKVYHNTAQRAPLWVVLKVKGKMSGNSDKIL